MSVVSVLLGLFTIVGAVTTVGVSAFLAWYVATRRPTPNATLREALTSLRWTHGFAWFVAPPALVGAQEFGVTGAAGGAGLGIAFLAYCVLLQWWWGPL